MSGFYKTSTQFPQNVDTAPTPPPVVSSVEKGKSAFWRLKNFDLHSPPPVVSSAETGIVLIWPETRPPHLIFDKSDPARHLFLATPLLGASTRNVHMGPHQCKSGTGSWRAESKNMLGLFVMFEKILMKWLILLDWKAILRRLILL